MKTRRLNLFGDVSQIEVEDNNNKIDMEQHDDYLYIFDKKVGKYKAILEPQDTTSITLIGSIKSTLNGYEVDYVSELFNLNLNVEHIDISNLDLSNTTDISKLLANLKRLKTVSMPNISLPNITRADYLFKNCINLEKINWNGMKLPNITKLVGVYKNCTKLKQQEQIHLNYL